MDPAGLFALGDAPTWKARSEGFRRLLGGQAVTADPWRLFPPWLRDHLPLPPGGGSPKTRYVEFLQSLQTIAPLWVRAQVPEPGRLWDELRAAGIKPWVHRRAEHAAKLGHDVDVYHLPAFERGLLEIQDLASQAVALACDPDPGERWWDACAGAGGKSLHLAALMNGKGVVVATDLHEGRLKETVRRARRSPWRNVTTRAWDGKHVPGKPASFHGVLVDAPCSAIGTWRRNPDARWLIDRDAVPRLAETQANILAAASAGVRAGGTLVYSVCTVTPAETLGVVRGFLESHPGFRLDPFPHPLTGAETDGTLLIWPQEADTDAMFIARMVRTS
jgi:16S rRNA (cytosine967-C5)-methyltransferase